MSHISTKIPPNNAVKPIFSLKLSPLNIETILGTTSPTNGILPTVITIKEDIKDTIITPI